MFDRTVEGNYILASPPVNFPVDWKAENAEGKFMFHVSQKHESIFFI